MKKVLPYLSLLTSVLIPLTSIAENLQYRNTLEEATAIAARLTAEQEDPMTLAIDRVKLAKTALDEITIKARTFGEISNDYDFVDDEVGGEYEAAMEQYTSSIQALGRFPHPNTLSALTPAVNHENTQVRLSALTALREGAAKDPNEPILNTVRETILVDPSPEIRREAFEVYCRWGNQADLLSLSMELGRKANPVQDLAVREWIRIEKELQALAEGADTLQVQQALE